MTDPTTRPPAPSRRLLGLSTGQWQTIVLAVLLAAVLLAATVPPVLKEVR